MTEAIAGAITEGNQLARTADIESSESVVKTFEGVEYKEDTVELYAFASSYWSTISGRLSQHKGRVAWGKPEEIEQARKEGTELGMNADISTIAALMLDMVRIDAKHSSIADCLHLHRIAAYWMTIGKRLMIERDAFEKKNAKSFTGSIHEAYTDGSTRAALIDITSHDSIRKSVLALRSVVPYVGNSHEEAMFLNALWGGIAGRLMVQRGNHANAHQK